MKSGKSLRKVLSAQKVPGCFETARLGIAQFFPIVRAGCVGLLKAVG